MNQTHTEGKNSQDPNPTKSLRKSYESKEAFTLAAPTFLQWVFKINQQELKKAPKFDPLRPVLFLNRKCPKGTESLYSTR